MSQIIIFNLIVLKTFSLHYLTFNLSERSGTAKAKVMHAKCITWCTINLGFFQCSTGDRSTISSKDVTNKPNDTTLA